MKALNTRRVYTVFITEGTHTEKISPLPIEKILMPNKDDFEYIYALNDKLDEILDLKTGESIYFQSNRDNKASKGIITRKEDI